MANYEKLKYGIGYIGNGIYKIRENGRSTRMYDTWKDMLRRCYSEKQEERYPTYKDCTVCDEWHNFQNFAQWYEENYYEIDEERMCLDKDILNKNNKIYSPKTCIFAPNRINTLFVKNNINRGKYPIGVSYHKATNKIRARCKDGYNNIIEIGFYETVEKAFYNGYKPFKEKTIKDIANKYKDKIPQKLYDAMCKYEVEITD